MAFVRYCLPVSVSPPGINSAFVKLNDVELLFLATVLFVLESALQRK